MPGALCEGDFALAVVAGCPLPLSGIGYRGKRMSGARRARGLDRFLHGIFAGLYCTSWTFYRGIGNAAQTP